MTRDDRGTIVVLAAAVVTLLAVLVGVLVDVVVLHRRQQQAEMTADGAARAAAQALDLDRYYRRDGRLHIDPPDARRFALGYLGSVDGGWRLGGLEVTGAQVQVRIHRSVALPFTGVIARSRVDVSAPSTARLRVIGPR